MMRWQFMILRVLSEATESKEDTVRVGGSASDIHSTTWQQPTRTVQPPSDDGPRTADHRPRTTDGQSIARLSLDPYRFCIDELQYAMRPQFAAIATLLDSSKGESWVGFHKGIDKTSPCLK